MKAACHIINIQSSKRHPRKTLMELFFNKKSNLSKLRIFGSVVFTTYTKPGNTKLEPRAHKSLYLSEDQNSKAIRCYNLVTKKVFVTKDIRSYDISSGLTTDSISLHKSIIIQPPQEDIIITSDVSNNLHATSMQ